MEKAVVSTDCSCSFQIGFRHRPDRDRPTTLSRHIDLRHGPLMANTVSVLAPKAAANETGEAKRPLIRIDGVSKTYQNGTVALADVKLDIRSGEFLSLLGPSGCGKSTLLRMIAGLGAPSSGVIDWTQARYDVSGEPERSLGFVFQEPTLMPWATVFENVYLPLRSPASAAAVLPRGSRR